MSTITAPVHAERALKQAPFSIQRKPSPVPNAPVELRLETTDIASPNLRRHSKGLSRGSVQWSGSDIMTTGPSSAVAVHGLEMVHVPLTAHPDAAGTSSKVIKSPTQHTAARDPIAMLLYLRRAVTMKTPPNKAEYGHAQVPVARSRRNSSASTASDSTAVGDFDTSKEKDLAEPWSAAAALEYVRQVPVPRAPAHSQDVEAHSKAADQKRSCVRRPYMMALIMLFVALFLAAAALGIYSIVHHGF